MYNMNTPNSSIKHQTQSHHHAGLNNMMLRTVRITRVDMVTEMTVDLPRSLNQRRRVMVLNPYRFSIMKFLYRLNGMSSNVPASCNMMKNRHPAHTNEPVREAIQSSYLPMRPPKKKMIKRRLLKSDSTSPNLLAYNQ